MTAVSRVYSIGEIIEAALAGTTLNAYKSYIKQFQVFCRANPEIPRVTEENQVDLILLFLHSLYERQLKSGTIDQAKSALVYMFNGNTTNIENPARNKRVKKYVLGLKKMKKKSGEEETIRAYPLSIYQLNEMHKDCQAQHPFITIFYRLVFAIAYLGCFRMAEVLNLKWRDVRLDCDASGVNIVVVRLTWSKTAQVGSVSQIYSLYNENEPSLQVCTLFEEYTTYLGQHGLRMTHNAWFLPLFAFDCTSGELDIKAFTAMPQNNIKSFIENIADNNPNIPDGLTLHSFRRGGVWFRCYVSKARRFNFRELESWCRWEDVSTMCTYLCTRQMSMEIDPTHLLKPREGAVTILDDNQQELTNTIIQQFSDAIERKLEHTFEGYNNNLLNINQNVITPSNVPLPVVLNRQGTLDQFARPPRQSVIPPPGRAKNIWDQWFTAIPSIGLFKPLKEINPKHLPRKEQQRYSPRRVIGLEMEKFSNYADFAIEYEGFLNGYDRLLKEVRRRRQATN